MLSLQVSYRAAFVKMFGKGYTEQGSLFEQLTVEALKHLGLSTHGTGWSKTAAKSIQDKVEALGKHLGEPSVTVHSFRVTALTTARERGADIVDLQDFAGHADPRTTLAYIRNRDRLSRSPAYALRY